MERLGGAEHTIIPDRIEAATFVIAAAITGGCLDITNCNPLHISAVLDKVRDRRVILKAGGSDLQYVLRCGVFLTDMNDFEEMNAAYRRVFGDHMQARTTVQVARLPRDARIEIEAVAVLK